MMGSIPYVNDENMEGFLRYIKDIDCDKEYLCINNIKFVNLFNSDFIKNNNHDYGVHLEEFYTDNEWDLIDFSGRHVIDIGGNIGDTPLYFAEKGAKVISFEPVPHLHDLAVKNVNINEKLAKNITLVNKGVGGKSGILSAHSNSVQGYIEDVSYDMEIISMQDLLEDYDFSPDILKMDCEGCEFEIIQNHDLTMFNDIILEHHSKIVGKSSKIIIEALKKQNFKINCYEIKASRSGFEDIGIIHAFK